jgi:hypothetical protein
MLKSYLIKGLIAAGIILILIFGKIFYMQRDHYLQAESYVATDLKRAILEYDVAMHNYTPWSPYIRRSAERLWQIGEMLERKGKPDLAVIAYSSIRSSFYASRSLYTPGKEWIEKCDDKIASLNVDKLVGEGTIKPGESETEKKKHLFVQKTDRAPDPLGSVLLELGFFGWVASIVFVIIKGFDEEGRVKVRTALYGMGFFICSFAIWVISALRT